MGSITNKEWNALQKLSCLKKWANKFYMSCFYAKNRTYTTCNSKITSTDCPEELSWCPISLPIRSRQNGFKEFNNLSIGQQWNWQSSTVGHVINELTENLYKEQKEFLIICIVLESIWSEKPLILRDHYLQLTEATDTCSLRLPTLLSRKRPLQNQTKNRKQLPPFL